MRKKITSAFFVLSLLCSVNGFSQEGRSLELGSAKSVVEGLIQNNTKTNLKYTFKTNSNKEIGVSVKDFYHENGQLSMSGEVEGNDNSLFILKGDEHEIYGYVVLHDTKKAYEYTTDVNGVVVVNEVPIAKIFADLYTADMSKPASEINGPRAVKALDYSPMAMRQMIHIGKYDNQKINELESLPGAELVFYLDITRVMNGDTPKHMSAAEMYKNWQCVADQLSMYELNVTTSPSVYAAAGVPNSGIARFLDQDGRSNAPLNSFGTTSYSSNYKHANGYGYGRTSAHEIGHQLGLSHDGGTPGGEYYEGIPAFQWCPIMGNYWFGNAWDQALFQYSKGEYAQSNQKQDDLTIIKRYMPFREDDVKTSKGMNIATGGVISPKENFGQIETNTDSDVFTFEIGGDGKAAGHIKLKLDAVEFISMLDIDAELRKVGGASIAKSNMDVNRSAQFDVDLPAGKYELVIKGGAEGTPQKGFSTYSSLGVYAMEGKITGAVITDVPKTVLENSINIFPVPASDVININMPHDARLENLQITNALGKVVYTSNQSTKAINVSEFSKGMYFINMKVSGEFIVKRFTKQ